MSSALGNVSLHVSSLEGRDALSLGERVSSLEGRDGLSLGERVSSCLFIGRKRRAQPWGTSLFMSLHWKEETRSALGNVSLHVSSLEGRDARSHGERASSFEERDALSLGERFSCGLFNGRKRTAWPWGTCPAVGSNGSAEAW